MAQNKVRILLIDITKFEWQGNFRNGLGKGPLPIRPILLTVFSELLIVTYGTRLKIAKKPLKQPNKKIANHAIIKQPCNFQTVPKLNSNFPIPTEMSAGLNLHWLY